MKTSIILATALISVCDGQSQQLCCKVAFTTESQTTSSTVVTISIINTGAESLFLSTSRADVDFKFELIDGSGQAAKRTQFGQTLLSGEKPGGSRIRKVLLPGESIEEVVELHKVFQLEARDYILNVSREVRVGQRAPTLLMGHTKLSIHD